MSRVKYNDGLSDPSDSSEGEASELGDTRVPPTCDGHSSTVPDSMPRDSTTPEDSQPRAKAYTEGADADDVDPDKPFVRMTEQTNFAYFKDKFIVNCNHADLSTSQRCKLLRGYIMAESCRVMVPLGFDDADQDALLQHLEVLFKYPTHSFTRYMDKVKPMTATKTAFREAKQQQGSGGRYSSLRNLSTPVRELRQPEGRPPPTPGEPTGKPLPTRLREALAAYRNCAAELSFYDTLCEVMPGNDAPIGKQTDAVREQLVFEAAVLRQRCDKLLEERRNMRNGTDNGKPTSRKSAGRAAAN